MCLKNVELQAHFFLSTDYPRDYFFLFDSVDLISRRFITWYWKEYTYLKLTVTAACVNGNVVTYWPGRGSQVRPWLSCKIFLYLRTDVLTRCLFLLFSFEHVMPCVVFCWLQVRGNPLNISMFLCSIVQGNVLHYRALAYQFLIKMGFTLENKERKTFYCSN